MEVFLGAVPKYNGTSPSALCSLQVTRRSLVTRSTPFIPAPAVKLLLKILLSPHPCVAPVSQEPQLEDNSLPKCNHQVE